MTNRPGIAQLIILATAGGASFLAASQFVGTDTTEDASESIALAVSAHANEAPAPPQGAAAAGAAGDPPATVDPLARENIDVGIAGDTFTSRSWAPPPPPPPPAAVAAVRAPPPAPAAPPLPFRFVGMLEQKSDKPTAFLANGEALHVVHVGDVIDGTYRIESLSPAKVVVTYLPLKQQQTLSVDGGQP